MIQQQPDRSKYLVWAILLLYYALSITWGFAADSPWDDDCPTRFFNTLQAFHDPQQFVSPWNRPLFVILFALPVKLLGKPAVILLMPLIAALSAWLLYRALRIRQTPYAWLAVPFLLFQVFYFSVSRNAETETLAAALIVAAFFFMQRKQWFAFAVMGALLPLARLELAILLPLWAWLLIREKQVRYIFVLPAGLLVWNFAGMLISSSGDALWLVHSVLQSGESGNRYGHQTFGHYFQRYIYVTGPVVFYFFFLGLLQQVVRRRLRLFTGLQFILGFLLYVVISWKLDSGNAAGFLRNLLPLAPLTAILALEGAVLCFSLREEPTEKKQLPDRILLLAGSGVVLLCTILFFSKTMEVHHYLDDKPDYTNLLFTSLCILSVVVFVLFRIGAKRIPLFAVLFSLLAIAHTLYTEPPGNNDNNERRIVSAVSRIYNEAGFGNRFTLVSHNWFFWINENSDRNDTLRYQRLTLKQIAASPAGSIIFWDSHYSNRLGNNVNIDSLLSNNQYLELVRKQSLTDHFGVHLLIKTDPKDTAGQQQIAADMVRRFPDEAGVYCSRGLMRLSRWNDQQGAVSDFTEAISRDTGNDNSYRGRGFANYNMHNYAAAVPDFRKTLRLNKKQPGVYVALSVSLGMIERVDEAIEVCNAGLAEFPGDKSMLVVRRDLNKKKMNVEAVLNDQLVLIRQQPDNARSYLELANVLNAKNDMKGAIEALDKAIQLDPKLVNAHINKAILLGRSGRGKEACAALQLAVDLGSEKAVKMQQEMCR
jgi:tetratricopeptide (TPR) repeat protein